MASDIVLSQETLDEIWSSAEATVAQYPSFADVLRLQMQLTPYTSYSMTEPFNRKVRKFLLGVPGAIWHGVTWVVGGFIRFIFEHFFPTFRGLIILVVSLACCGVILSSWVTDPAKSLPNTSGVGTSSSGQPTPHHHKHHKHHHVVPKTQDGAVTATPDNAVQGTTATQE